MSFIAPWTADSSSNSSPWLTPFLGEVSGLSSIGGKEKAEGGDGLASTGRRSSRLWENGNGMYRSLAPLPAMDRKPARVGRPVVKVQVQCLVERIPSNYTRPEETRHLSLVIASDDSWTCSIESTSGIWR